MYREAVATGHARGGRSGGGRRQKPNATIDRRVPWAPWGRPPRSCGRHRRRRAPCACRRHERRWRRRWRSSPSRAREGRRAMDTGIRRTFLDPKTRRLERVAMGRDSCVQLDLRPRRKVSAGRCFSPTSFSATTPATRANTRATRPTDPSRPPTRAPTEPARISSSHGHHARCVRARSIPPARLRASASPRASRHRPTPRLLADAEPPPTAPTSTGVRQTTLNATRSSNFVRFMLACVPSRASSTRARARGQPLARRDPPSFPRAQLCARARVRAPRAISASAND